jgi:hypothetical protein
MVPSSPPRQPPTLTVSRRFGSMTSPGQKPSKSASSLIRRRLVHSRRDQSRWATSDLLAQDGTDPPAKPQSSTGAVTHRQAGPDFESKFFRRRPDQIALPPALLRAYLLLRQRRHCHGCEVGIEPIKGFTMVNVASARLLPNAQTSMFGCTRADLLD